MISYIVRRLLWMIPTLFFVALITFMLMHAAPGGPWDRDLSARQVDPRTQELLNKEFGLDKPLFINTEGGNPLDSQFFNYIGGALQGNLGPSYRQRGMNVEDILFKPQEGKPIWSSKFGYSMRLGLLALGLAVLFGIPLGAIGALKRNTVIDYFSLLISTIGFSVPSFVLAIFLIVLLAGLYFPEVGIFNYVPFAGGGEAKAAILGGHVTEPAALEQALSLATRLAR